MVSMWLDIKTKQKTPLLYPYSSKVAAPEITTRC